MARGFATFATRRGRVTGRFFGYLADWLDWVQMYHVRWFISWVGSMNKREQKGVEYWK